MASAPSSPTQVGLQSVRRGPRPAESNAREGGQVRVRLRLVQPGEETSPLQTRIPRVLGNSVSLNSPMP